MAYATADQPLDFGEPERGRLVHVLMPCMVYACGGGVLDDQPGRFILGVYGDQWERVSCPECRAPGRDAIQAEQRRQQGRQG